MKAKVTSEIKHRTARGTDMVIRFVDAHNRAYFEAEIPSMFPGARGVSRSKLRDRITGKPVEIASFMAECDGSIDGCSTDYVVRSVWPDGSIREERTHTY